MRFYAKSRSADLPINFRFRADACTSILAERFYTVWAGFCLLLPAALLLAVDGHFSLVQNSAHSDISVRPS